MVTCAAPQASSLYTSLQATESPCILVVDDEAAIQYLERVVLEEHAFLVKVASNGEEALDILAESTPDLVLLDVELGGIDGFTTCQRIRQTSDVPILMVTSRDSVGDRIWGLEVGADDYLTKPFHPDELVARVKASLRRSKMCGGGAEAAPEPESLPMPLNQANSHQSESCQEASTPPIPDSEAGGGMADLEITGTVRQILIFVEQLRQDGRFRLFRLVGRPSQGMNVQIGLREPVHLQNVLLGMKDVGQVSLLDGGEVRCSVELQ